MEIKKLFERNDVESTSGSAQQAAKKRGVAAFQDQQAQADAARRAGEDSVTISPLSRQLAQLSQILSEDEAQQADRVAELKRQVEEGTYSVSRDDVARSVVSFAADTAQ
ncbi:MAG: flagellar biosynthesis anti-sigma factor FlgM [Bdellovibrionales bacterium]|nr:flagellar biosynthesis anti-sigma factor FlgM [Bdellovibrionales bacterium]